MEKIESLIPEQEQQLVEFREKWLQVGLCTDRIDKKAAAEVMTDFYKRIGEEAPYIWYCESQMTAQLVINVLQKQELLTDNLRANLGDNLGDNLEANLWDNLGANLRDNLWANLGANLRDNLWANLRDNLWANLRANLWANLRANLGDNLEANLGDNLEANLAYHPTDMWGQQDAYWIAWYLFPHKHLRAMHSESDTELLMQWAKLAQASGWVYPFKGVCFVCDRPSEIHRDEQGLLHNEKGPSVSFVDTWSLYHWHGVEIPGEWIKTPPTAQEAISWENVEQRRAACELVGWHNVLDQLDAKTIDKDANPQIGTLLEVDLPDSGRERFLQVRCGTGRDFALPVPPDVNTALEANAWTYDVPTQVIQAIEVRT